jgi:hypothetical protein
VNKNSFIIAELTCDGVAVEVGIGGVAAPLNDELPDTVIPGGGINTNGAVRDVAPANALAAAEVAAAAELLLLLLLLLVPVGVDGPNDSPAPVVGGNAEANGEDDAIIDGTGNLAGNELVGVRGGACDTFFSSNLPNLYVPSIRGIAAIHTKDDAQTQMMCNPEGSALFEQSGHTYQS